MGQRIIKIAVLGQGRSGYDIHVAWLRRAPEQYQVVAVTDPLPDRREAVKDLGAKGFGDYKELFAQSGLEIDLVVNALPSHEHVSGTIAALEAGYDVLCEKPVAQSVAEFDTMTAAADKAGRHLFAFHNSRFNPAFRKLQEVLASGVLGELVHARLNFSNFARRWDWQASQRYGGGNLSNTGAHPLDQAIVLFGERMPEVFSQLICHNDFGDADNFASVSLHGPDAPLVEVVASSFMAYPQGEHYNLACTHGGLTGNLQSLRWKYFDPATAPQHEPDKGWAAQRKYTSEKLEWVEESWTAEASGPGTSKALYDNLYDVLVHDAEPVVTLAQVRRQIAVIEESHRQNPLPKRF